MDLRITTARPAGTWISRDGIRHLAHIRLPPDPPSAPRREEQHVWRGGRVEEGEGGNESISEIGRFARFSRTRRQFFNDLNGYALFFFFPFPQENRMFIFILFISCFFYNITQRLLSQFHSRVYLRTAVSNEF